MTLRHPESSLKALSRWLTQDWDIPPAAAWAADLLEAGFDSDEIVSMATLEPDDREAVRNLTPIVLAQVGFDLSDCAGLAVIAERALLQSMLSGELAAEDVLTTAEGLWSGADHDARWQYQDISRWLELIRAGSVESPPGYSTDDPGPWVVEQIRGTGAFDRTGLGGQGDH